MKKTALRTDEHRFDNLPDYPFQPHYLAVSHPGYESLRMHYVDESHISMHDTLSNNPAILLLHGCPTWSYLYRKVISTLLQSSTLAGSYRILAPDWIGCGKSDKLRERTDYSYDAYVSWLNEFITQLDLHNIILVCQDWGGPIGLRSVSEMPQRFAGIVVTNTLLPTAEPAPRGVTPWPGDLIRQWIQFTSQASDLSVSQVVQGSTLAKLSPDVLAAYDAPFPNVLYKQGMLNWPSLIPLDAGHPGITENRLAWQMLETYPVPLLTAFSEQDPSTIGWEKIFQQRAAGAHAINHQRIPQAGHMVQEDQGELLAKIIAAFCTELANRG